RPGVAAGPGVGLAPAAGGVGLPFGAAAPSFGFLRCLGGRGGTVTFSGGGAPRNGVPFMSPWIDVQTCFQIQETSLAACEYDRDVMLNGTERSSRADGATGEPSSLKAG